jgi:hypothetical protein
MNKTLLLPLDTPLLFFFYIFSSHNKLFISALHFLFLFERHALLSQTTDSYVDQTFLTQPPQGQTSPSRQQQQG